MPVYASWWSLEMIEQMNVWMTVLAVAAVAVVTRGEGSQVVLIVV